MTKVESFKALKEIAKDNANIVAFIDNEIKKEENRLNLINEIENKCQNTVAMFSFTDTDRHQMKISIDFIHPREDNTYFVTLHDDTARQYCGSRWCTTEEIKTILLNNNCERA